MSEMYLLSLQRIGKIRSVRNADNIYGFAVAMKIVLSKKIPIDKIGGIHYNMTMKNSNAVPFHQWLDEEGYTIQKFASLIHQGFSTVAKWRIKSVKGEPIKIKTVSLSNIRQICPSCPLVTNAQ